MDTPSMQDIRALILPVGITPDPVIFTIEQIRPEFLGLIGTRASEATLEKLFEAIPFAPHRVKHVTVEDSPERIGDLVQHVYDLYHWLRFEKQLDARQIAIDPTPGRKWMSAGATMVASHLGLPMFYVDVRFVDGKADPSSMRLVRLGNAYDQTGFLLADRGRTFFNKTHFAAAADAFDQIQPSRAQEADYFQGMGMLARTLHRWDLFEHYQTPLLPDFEKALDHLRRHARSVTVGADFHRFIEQVDQLARAIDEVSRSSRPSLLAVADLVQNADRKIAQGHYDDAVARLYRAFEAIAQYFLIHDFQIDPSAPRWDQKPEEVRAAAQRACGTLPGKIANVHGWSILRELEHPAAGHVFVRTRGNKWQLKLMGLLEDRNQSILAHGWKPISTARAQKMAARLRELLHEIEPETLTPWLQRLVVPKLPTPVARSPV